MIDADGVADRFDLGSPTSPPTQVHGGLLNRLWRLDTGVGSFAVKELNLDRGWALRHDDVLRLELAARAAGIPVPEPVPDPATGSALAVVGHTSVVVHRWVDGQPVAEDAPVAAPFASAVGEQLARLHALEVDWPHVSIEDPMPTEATWQALADRAVATDQPWAELLSATVPELGEIGRLVDAIGRPEPIVLTHRDVGQKNLLDLGGLPVIVDWETAGKLPLACELGQTALNLASGASLDDLRPDVFHALLDGYEGAGGTLPRPGRHWFADRLSGWTWFVAWNVERCLAGVEPLSGPSLDVAHDVVERGLRGLPVTLRRLDELAALTDR